MEKAIMTKRGSYKIEVEKGKTYYWCSCGLSQNQPFCDGSHKNSDFKSLKYIAEESKIVGFCGCRATSRAPFCDGAHKKLPECEGL